jgi:putative endonuclease
VSYPSLQRHPEGRQRARAFISGRVALRDLLFAYGESLLRLHDGQHFTTCTVRGRYCVSLLARLAAQEQSRWYFTTKYKCYRLVYFEQFTSVEAAIAREKGNQGLAQRKEGQTRQIDDPGWKDLAADWYPKGLMKHGF